MTHQTSKRLAGKIALVTGGSRGIGRSIVQRFAEEGISFIGIHYSGHLDAVKETIEIAESFGTQAVALQADFSTGGKISTDHLWDQFQEALHSFGHDGFDILVNCAGVAPQASIYQTTEEIYNRVLSINFGSSFFLIQSAGPHIRPGGRIINLSSALTRIADPVRAIYSASKGAINALTLSLAPEYGARNITVNAVAPGVIDTDMNSGWLHEAEARKQAEKISVFSRVGEPEDVASLVTFLASEDGRWLTGQIIDVSGGSCL